MSKDLAAREQVFSESILVFSCLGHPVRGRWLCRDMTYLCRQFCLQTVLGYGRMPLTFSYHLVSLFTVSSTGPSGN